MGHKNSNKDMAGREVKIPGPLEVPIFQKLIVASQQFLLGFRYAPEKKIGYCKFVLHYLIIYMKLLRWYIPFSSYLFVQQCYIRV